MLKLVESRQDTHITLEIYVTLHPLFYIEKKLLNAVYFSLEVK